MEKILLIEPSYNNKYPPVGLMKISTYFKNKGSFVEFHKGLLSHVKVEKFDKVFITTLFTFEYDLCIQTINYYISIKGIDNVLVGGIASTIMTEKFADEIPGLKIIRGQLKSSNILGYSDSINIDELELDYDILLDTDYEYAMADSYFIYTSRGCPRKCEFCAVKSLEPTFRDCDNLNEQISAVDNNFGIKKNLLIMDNNILYSKKLRNNVQILKELGFGQENNTIKKNNVVKYYLRSLRKRIREKRIYVHVLNKIKDELNSLKFIRINKDDKEKLEKIILKVNESNDFVAMRELLSNQEYLCDFFERYHYHKIKRYVDFNQGLDARLFTNAKAKILSALSIKPCRIAFDDLKTQTSYFNALDFCVNNGIKYFSNYLLYNYNEKPHDLWTRLSLNIQYCKKHKEVTLFSFPMKYADITKTDRNYVGKYWNKKYLRAMNVILNVTKGVVAKEDDFFYRAFGNSEMEFLEILSMPDEFIKYRDYYEELNLSNAWRQGYRKLSIKKKKILIDILSRMVDEPELLEKKYDSEISFLLMFYKLRRKQIEKNGEHYIDSIFEYQEIDFVIG